MGSPTRFHRPLATLIAPVLLLTACGGGGSSTADPSTPQDESPQNSPPELTSASEYIVPENQADTFLLLADDPDGDTLTFSLGGVDAASFDLDPQSGEFAFINAPSFERPTDSDADNVYDLIATVSDGTSSTSQNLTITITAAAMSDVIAIFGAAPGDESGISVSSAGDLDGDGRAEILIGAPGAGDGSTSNAGESYLLWGSDLSFNTNGSLDLSNVQCDAVKIQGLSADDLLGTFVSSAGDIDRDGRNDLLVGAPGAAPLGQADAGETYLFWGATLAGDEDGVVTVPGAIESGLTLIGAEAFGELGLGLSSADDFNNDDTSDIIVGAPGLQSLGRTDAGGSYVLSGADLSADVDGEIDLSFPGTSDVFIAGATANEASGRSVTSLGDLDDDGFSEIVVGAPSGGSGSAYVVFGSTLNAAAGTTVDLFNLGAGGVELIGAETGDQTGLSLSGAGDIDGDGLRDLVIGAPSFSPSNQDNAGAVYIVWGAAVIADDDGVIDLSAPGEAGLVVTGRMAGAEFGSSVAIAGDVDGDGLDDVIVGAPMEDGLGRTNAGVAYLLWGANLAAVTGPIVDLSNLESLGVEIIGSDAFDLMGSSVAGAGDVDADGRVDVIIGARSASPANRNEAGISYLVSGRFLTDERSDDQLIDLHDVLSN